MKAAVSRRRRIEGTLMTTSSVKVDEDETLRADVADLQGG